VGGDGGEEEKSCAEEKSSELVGVKGVTPGSPEEEA
jgi:hypothetical protein